MVLKHTQTMIRTSKFYLSCHENVAPAGLRRITLAALYNPMKAVSGICVGVMLLLAASAPASGQELETRWGSYLASLSAFTTEPNVEKLSRPVSLHLEDVTIREALEHVSALGGLYLAMDDEADVYDRPVSFHVEHGTVIEVLQEIIADTDLTLKISPSGFLIVAPRPASAKPITVTPMVSTVQGGKIAGRVTDAETAEPIPGVNVVIDGTTTGATTDVEGYYAILNAPPGTYTLRASYIGYTTQIVEDVRVNIDLTTEINFEMQEETVGLDEVVITAQAPIVQRDISANVANLSSDDIKTMPVASVEGVVELLAGVESGLSVRGSGFDELAFIVDGMTMHNGRDNTPFTGISYTAIDELQVQTGGFNAEYGNVRSGLINVVTKEGPRDRYTADAMVRYSPPAQKYFGTTPADPNSYFLRPYLDPQVAFTGTDSDEGGWDPYLQRQYPEFDGFNDIAEILANDADPTNDLTPQQLQDIFRFRFRKPFDIEAPDYDVDVSVGGPFPLLSPALGGLRFFGSYRQTQTAYVVPQQRDAYRERTGHLKLTSDIAPRMKLQITGMYNQEFGLNTTSTGFPSMFRGEMPSYPWSGGGMVNELVDDVTLPLYAYSQWVPMNITRNMVGLEFTHTLNPKTYYDVRLQRTKTDYSSFPGRRRDTTTVMIIGGYRLDEAPYGWEPAFANDFTGARLGAHWGPARDTSNVSAWNAKFDATSQVNRFVQVQGGFEYIYSDYDISHGEVDSFNVSQANPKYKWTRQPQQGAVYGQTKLEFQGMIANLGLRLDYFDPSGEWYLFEPYDRALSASFGADELDEVLEKERIDRQFSLNPRLGVSFPITENSKLYFNYGHFRQALAPTELFVVEKVSTGAVGWIGNPNHPMPKTVAYEMGYEHNLFDRFLLRLTGYYKALGNQPRDVTLSSVDGEVEYEISRPDNYGDIRGFEITLTKNVGRWVRGFVNYTYMSAKRGNFGFGEYFENRVEQRRYERDSRAHYQERPTPEPYARFNLEFLTPPDFGSTAARRALLGDWHFNILGEWRSGEVFTWGGGGGEIIGLRDNVQWRDYYNLDLRLSKEFNTGFGEALFFVDATNVLNLKFLHNSAGFQGANDDILYMQSLHLPEDAFGDGAAPYAYIPGNDRPGDYRKPGVEFVPIEIVGNVEGLNEDDVFTRPLYFETDNNRYMKWDGSAWKEADPALVDQVLKDKAYIDMPNAEFFRFLNPRQFRFGVRITL